MVFYAEERPVCVAEQCKYIQIESKIQIFEYIIHALKKEYQVISSQITSRFVEFVNFSLENGKIKTKSEFCRKLEYHVQGLNAIIQSDNRAIPLGFIPLLQEHYDVNPDWLIFGTGEMFSGTIIDGKSKVANDLIESLQETISSQKETIALQKELIDNLKAKG